MNAAECRARNIVVSDLVFAIIYEVIVATAILSRAKLSETANKLATLFLTLFENVDRPVSKAQYRGRVKLLPVCFPL